MASSIKKCLRWYNRMAKKMRWQEVTLLKIAVFFFALAVANLWPSILIMDWYIYGIIFVVAYAWLIRRLEK